MFIQNANDLVQIFAALPATVRRIYLGDRAGEAFENLENIANPPVTPININHDPDNTHTDSVNQSVSISVKKLNDRYGKSIDNNKLADIFNEIKQIVSNATESDPAMKEVALRCIERITADDYIHDYKISNVSIQQLLALNYRAITDDTHRICSLNDAVKQLIKGLYEIQRGKNLSAMGVDHGGVDSKICIGGTFNKLIEVFIDVHPDYSINFISLELASLKLPVVVREEANAYLKSLANPQSTEALANFIHLIDQLNKEGVEVIWDNINEKVSARILEEFGSLAQTLPFGAAKLANLIKAGEYTPLNDLCDFKSLIKSLIQESKAYQKYCSATLKMSSVFFSQQSAEHLSAHRHDNADVQQKI